MVTSLVDVKNEDIQMDMPVEAVFVEHETWSEDCEVSPCVGPRMQLELEGKIVIVTGGSKGRGRAGAVGFLAEGAAVLVRARGQESRAEI